MLPYFLDTLLELMTTIDRLAARGSLENARKAATTTAAALEARAAAGDQARDRIKTSA